LPKQFINQKRKKKRAIHSSNLQTKDLDFPRLLDAAARPHSPQSTNPARKRTTLSLSLSSALKFSTTQVVVRVVEVVFLNHKP
jgi:hypothetical protein